MAKRRKAAKKKGAAKKVSKKVVGSKLAAYSKKKTKASMKGKKAKKPVGSCFILMPFETPFDIYYSTIIKPAVTSADLKPMRGDSLFTPTPIMGDVWQMIQDANVLLAELTGKNPNVFYELGLGHAIGKPIVLISETMDDVPFDLQQLRVILYDKNDPSWGNKLKTSITTSLQETLASPIEAVPPMFRKKVKSQAPADTEMSLRLSSLETRVSSILAELRHGRFSARESLLAPNLRKMIHESWKRNKIMSREEAVKWASRIVKRKRISSSELAMFLQDQLNANEADKIMNSALEA